MHKFSNSEEVRKLDKQARMELLSRYNLEITLAELARCRQAVRDGNIWRLVEQRSHQHPALRDAYLWLTTNPATAEYVRLNNESPLDEITSSQETSNHGGFETGWNWIIDSQLTPAKEANSGLVLILLVDLILSRQETSCLIDGIQELLRLQVTIQC